MDFLIWIIILLVINAIAGGKKKPKQQQPPIAPPTVYEQQSPARRSSSGGLGGFVREFVQDIHDVIGDGDNSSRQPSQHYEQPQRQRSARRQQRELTPIEQECEYCVGTNTLDEQLSQSHLGSITATKPIVPLEAAGFGFVDMQAMQKELKLSDAQNAVLWQEILDKPLSLRRRK